MKSLSTMDRCWNGKTSYLLISLLVSGLLSTFAVAQLLTPKLSESEIRSVIPILKTEIAGYGQLEKAVEMERDARFALIHRIKSGKIDPLDWLKQHSKYVMVPPGAIYEPACSRAVSIAGWEVIVERQPREEEIANITTPPVRPKVVFTFGKEIPAINKNALIKRSKNIDISGESMYDINNPSYQEMRSILESSRSFYSQRGFSANYSISGDAVIFYPTYAEGEISGVVLAMYYDAFDPNFTDVRKNCMSLPVGPTVEIEAGDKLMEKAFKPGKTKVGTDDDNIKRNLQEAGITEERYAEIKAALIAARANSESPEEQEPAALDFTPTTPEEKQAAQEYEKAVQIMKEEIRAKKNSIQLYKKYKADLDPILDILQKYMGGQ